MKLLIVDDEALARLRLRTLIEGLAETTPGFALHNIRERLRLLHDVAAQCDVWRDVGEEGEMFHARIVLPAP